MRPYKAGILPAELCADGEGLVFLAAVTRSLTQVNVEIVKRSDLAEGLSYWQSDGSWNGHSHGLDAADRSPKIGKISAQGARLSAPLPHRAHVEEAMQSSMISSERL